MESDETTIKDVLYVKVMEFKKGFVHFEGSHESIYLGDWWADKVGKVAKITFEVASED